MATGLCKNFVPFSVVVVVCACRRYFVLGAEQVLSLTLEFVASTEVNDSDIGCRFRVQYLRSLRQSRDRL